MFGYLQRRLQGRLVTPNYSSPDHAARRLRESAEQYRFTFESNPLPMLIIERETQAFLDVNQAALRQYGFPRQEFLCLKLPDLLPVGADHPAGQEGLTPTQRHFRKNGTILDVELAWSPILFNGHSALIVAVHDVTELRREHAALLQREARFRAIFESTTEAMLVFDLTGTLIEVNPEACRMYGYACDTMVGATMHTLVDPSDHSVLERFLQQVKVGDRYSIQQTHRRKAGVPFSAEVHASAFELGGKPHLLALVGDVTDRKNLEEQLRHSQKMEAVGQLAQGIAHDFNNLLTAITGYSQVLLNRLDENDALRPKVEEILKAGNQATSLTNQLLAIGRRRVWQPTLLDMNAVVSNMASLLSRLIGDHIDMLTILDPGLGCVRADQSQVEQVLLNLAVNARDAMPQGGTLSLKTSNLEVTDANTRQHPTVPCGSYVLLTVSDTGCGMSADTLGRIFEPFFTTKEAGKGTGLGLSTVYGIVQQSGGQILVDSGVERGTTFRVYVPRIRQEPPPLRFDEPVARPLQGAGTILIVDDSEAVRSLSRDLLESHGYTVLEAIHGSGALLVGNLHNGPVHLLLADVVMPGMTGPQLADSLRPSHPDLKVIYMSGYSHETIVEQGLVDSGTPILAKPISPDDLVRKVREALGQEIPGALIRPHPNP